MSAAPEKQRLDVSLVARGLAESREKAQALVMAGLVYIGENKADKPSQTVTEAQEIIVRGATHPYVSRGALKLEKALKLFPVDPSGKVCVDVGASTGGFTDVLLRANAQHIYAVDVGYGQLDYKLRVDPRVTVMERTNARYLTVADFALPPSLAVMDVSFISTLKIFPSLFAILGENGACVSLIKPQFEAGRDRVGKKGVVKDPAVHADVIKSVRQGVAAMGWHMAGLSFSPITGPEGNIEFLAHLLPGSGASVADEDVDRAVTNAHQILHKESGLE